MIADAEKKFTSAPKDGRNEYIIFKIRRLTFFSFRKRIFLSTQTGEPTVLWFGNPVSLVPVRGTVTLCPVVVLPSLRTGKTRRNAAKGAPEAPKAYVEVKALPRMYPRQFTRGA